MCLYEKYGEHFQVNMRAAGPAFKTKNRGTQITKCF